MHTYCAVTFLEIEQCIRNHIGVHLVGARMIELYFESDISPTLR